MKFSCLVQYWQHRQMEFETWYDIIMINIFFLNWHSTSYDSWLLILIWHVTRCVVWSFEFNNDLGHGRHGYDSMICCGRSHDLVWSITYSHLIVTPVLPSWHHGSMLKATAVNGQLLQKRHLEWIVELLSAEILQLIFHSMERRKSGKSLGHS